MEKPFAELTRAEQRVALAEEVLVRLKNRTLEPAQGVYVSLTEEVLLPQVSENLQLQQLLPALPVCEVCALGALFVALVALDNQCTVGQAFPEADSGATLLPALSRVASFVLWPRLESFFGSELDLIEAAFEQNRSFALNNAKEAAAAAVQFGLQFNEEFGGDYDRLVAIMENIIKNEGSFRP